MNYESLGENPVARLLVSGGAGFIGSNFVRLLLQRPDVDVVVLDALTYAGNLHNLDGCIDGSRCSFVKGSINDTSLVDDILSARPFDGIVNIAAETHVDRSIASAAPFIETNVTGTLVLLEAARRHKVGRFLQVSTDEVYGSLGADGVFTETSPLDPSSPYSASKASADCLVNAFVRTYGMDAVITRCSNNYGPFQFPEKFIPLMILNACEDRPLPIYGDGRQVRDWLHVNDHCSGIMAAFERGRAGEVYNIGGFGERENIDVARTILDVLDKPHTLMTHVADRPGHDRRYAIDPAKISSELGWKPSVDFAEGLASTIRWYVENESWCASVRSGEYREYYQRQYGTTL